MCEENRYLQGKPQKIQLTRIHDKKRILDIGGGGEGIIGKLYGRDVVAIDRRLDELYETQNEALKIEMDAVSMKFVDSSFDAITSFYTLMYMDDSVKASVLSECYRVLRDEGTLEIWDTHIPRYEGGSKDVYLANLEVQLPEETIQTAYGVLMKQREQSFEGVIKMCEIAGFNLVHRIQENDSFYIRLKK